MKKVHAERFFHTHTHARRAYTYMAMVVIILRHPPAIAMHTLYYCGIIKLSPQNFEFLTERKMFACSQSCFIIEDFLQIHNDIHLFVSFANFSRYERLIIYNKFSMNYDPFVVKMWTMQTEGQEHDKKKALGRSACCQLYICHHRLISAHPISPKYMYVDCSSYYRTHIFANFSAL